MWGRQVREGGTSSKLKSAAVGAVVLAAGYAFGSAAAAAPAGPPGLFLSPAGEPFRQGPETADPVGAWFSAADADQDGRISAAEFINDAMRFFGTVDQNGDGRIDRPENQRYERIIVPELGESLAGFRGPGELPVSLTGEQQPVRAGDVDLNQYVTEAEFRALAGRRFVALNVVRDTGLTREELPLPKPIATPAGVRPGTRARRTDETARHPSNTAAKTTSYTLEDF